MTQGKIHKRQKRQNSRAAVKAIGLALLLLALLTGIILWQQRQEQSPAQSIAQNGPPPTNWFTLSQEQRARYIAQGMVLFPEIFGTERNKYDRYARWLLDQHHVFNRSARADLTSGGRGTLVIKNVPYQDIPRIFLTLDAHAPELIQAFAQIDQTTLNHYWNMQAPLTPAARQAEWLKLYIPHAQKTLKDKTLDLEGMIEEYAQKYAIPPSSTLQDSPSATHTMPD